MTNPLSLAIIGAGKIARDQHMPAIAAHDAWSLAAVIDPAGANFGVPVFETLAELLAQGPAVDAVAICTPPQVRTAIALQAIEAGLHVLLEKPPAATLSDVAAIEAAIRPGRIVYATWHSRHAPMVAAAREWLTGKAIRSGRLIWREDARRWHPGQHWLWKPGGFGVFDPAINAFSILTEITNAPCSVTRADFQIPSGLHAPISAQLDMAVGTALLAVDLDFRDDDTPQWTIEVETDTGMLELREGGARLYLNGEAEPEQGTNEYAEVYRRFASLVANGRSEIDVRPFRLVADAFLIARTTTTEPFVP